MARLMLPLRGQELPDGRIVVRTPRSRRVTILSQRQADLLRRRAFEQGANPEHSDEVLAEWIVEASQIFTSASTGAREAPGVTKLAVVTRDRPECVARLLSRLINTEGEVLIVDQSAQAAKNDANKSMPYRLRHITREVRDNYVRRLRRQSGCDDVRILDFILKEKDPYPAYGANMNVALLLTAGSGVALLDDDVDPRVGRPRDSRASVSYRPWGDPTQLLVHTSNAQAHSTVEWSADSLAGSHGTALGRSLSELHTHLPDVLPISREALSSKLVEASVNGDAFVRATAHGIVGDCGLWSLHNYAMLPHQQGSPFFSEDEDVYRTVRGSRQVVRASRDIAVTPGGFLMNASMAIDNTTVPPPFTPLLRNMDGIWAQVVGRCDRNGFLCFLPQVVAHEASGPRNSQAAGDSSNAGELRVSDLLGIMVLSTQIAEGLRTIEDTLGHLGRAWRAIAMMSSDSFRTYIEDQCDSILVSRLSALAATRQSLGTIRLPLTADLEAQMRAIEHRLLTGRRGFLDWGLGGGWVESLVSLKAHVDQLGHMYEVWPHLWHAAVKLEPAAQADVV